MASAAAEPSASTTADAQQNGGQAMETEQQQSNMTQQAEEPSSGQNPQQHELPPEYASGFAQVLAALTGSRVSNAPCGFFLCNL